MDKKRYHTNYSVAVNWLNNAFVLCNKLPEIDMSVYDNMVPFGSFEDDDIYGEIFQ